MAGLVPAIHDFVTAIPPTTAYPPAKAPATAPLMHVAIVPDRIVRIPSSTISARRDGTIAPSPPITIPKLPKFANPHSEYVKIIRVRGENASTGIDEKFR